MLLLLVGMTACKDKGKDKGRTSLAPKELTEAYTKLKLPYYVVDSTMNEKIPAKTISLASFTKYIPDTIFNTTFGKDRNLTLQPIGQIDEKSREDYFITYVKSKSKAAIYLSVYDSSKHTVSMPLVTSDEDDITNTASIDKRLTIVINKEWTIKNDIYYNRSIYAYNNVGLLTTVLTETNEQRRTDDIITNPLDTFPKTYKYSGDYGKGSKGYLFIRDGNTANEYLFFVHFKSGTEEEPCGGELRGKFNMVSDKEGQYASAGDPCGMSLIFKGNEVQVKENGSCGNYRDIKCFFNDTYTKKKETKTTTKKK